MPGADFGFVGYGDPSFYAWIGDGLSTLQLPTGLMADYAVACLRDESDQASGSNATDARLFEVKLMIRR